MAAQAIGHRLFSDGSGRSDAAAPAYDPASLRTAETTAPNQDMGGNDFGIADTSSWDSGGDTGASSSDDSWDT